VHEKKIVYFPSRLNPTSCIRVNLQGFSFSSTNIIHDKLKEVEE